ncbi:bestrophin-like domain [Actinophytocola algeriensis]|uniref:DUF4239 domain-containing protein n=1 Tax=Actinophytocola algeriensis TaxID=1768010 RepID=A0A7W7QEQ9_9PSEU|nr:hypothetical protein [Actinophytocola algeriensis]MBB4912272.1 hypothetical protein [Actinophytocola algeriensis]MBE1474212.1 hypothetical protein [Actinophytocola algeriensis]
MAFDIAVFFVLPLLLVIVVTVLAGRRARARSEEYDSDSVSFVGGVLCAMFTVVLAFFVVFAWQNGADLDSHATAESDAVLDTYWQMAVVPQPDADAVRTLLSQYARQVADREWPALTDGRDEPEVADTIVALRAAVTALPIDAEVVAEARKQALQNLRTIDEHHRARVAMATSTDAFTIALLVGTAFGAVLMIAFPLIFGLSRRPANLVLMVLLTVTLSATMYVSWQLMHPLEGFFGATPDVFRAALDEMTAQSGT